MMVTTELVERLASLSRLRLPREEQEKMTGELEQILGYMDVLQKLDTSRAETLAESGSLKNVLREDEVIPSQDRVELLRNAPASDGETFLVPKAVE